ncbi:hypothetical protein QMO46_05255 [Microbacterium barkeri]|uniref:hypothetical protein n=1 Tax=Microbacterium barkeri TaxID=33917 RepID=UPI0024AECB0E|nr:hypothetical protein [Microbacterium barkeri]MDI6942899.1 hypothetical protein [Microbacterium barkeri]
MGRHRMNLPQDLGDTFAVRDARALGVGEKRLRAADLGRPFRGIRTVDLAPCEVEDPYERQRQQRLRLARAYAHRLHPGHFFCRETAASVWGAPLPLVFTPDGAVADETHLGVHVGVIGPTALPRARGVIRHRAQAKMTSLREHAGLLVTSPATTWAGLGTLPLPDLIALGDFFCRVWREGVGRPTPGRPPLATVAQLEAALATGRWQGIVRLREAVGWIRPDAWSPKESRVRFELVCGGLPEPELNGDVFDDSGRFLACVDMLYRRERVAIEYLGMLHGASWARDVERIASLRAAGWTVVEVTAPLLANPRELVRRVRHALGGRRA